MAKKEVVTLKEHIEKHYKGSVLKYAAKTGFNFATVYQWMKKGAVVIEGYERPLKMIPKREG